MESPGTFLLPSDRAEPWHQSHLDRLTRWKEERHQQRSEGIPSPEAVDEAWDYYAGLYLAKSPDPISFSRLIRRRGVPNWANPYDIADERHHEIHREGFLWADVQFLVSDLLSRSSAPLNEEDPGYQELLSRRHHAQICWLMVLQETGGRWPSSLSPIHPDNLVAITLEALLNPHLAMWGIDPALWSSEDLAGR